MAAIADTFVRAARGSDADALADLQLGCWREAYADVLPPDALEAVTADRDGVAERWKASVEQPPGPRYHVLVAVAGEAVVGSTALAPTEESADLNPAVVGEVLVLQVDRAHRRDGHGSRLLAAAVDHLRADGFVAAVSWLDRDDAATAELLGSTGWAPDGTTRTLDLDGDGTVVVHQVRWHTDLTDTEGAP